jgi:hypothetical protein
MVNEKRRMKRERTMEEGRNAGRVIMEGRKEGRKEGVWVRTKMKESEVD